MYWGPWALATVWPDWAIYWTLGNFSKPLATINLPNSSTFFGNFVKVSKSLIFLMKSFLGNFYRNLATFYWSHWWATAIETAMVGVVLLQKNKHYFFDRTRQNFPDCRPRDSRNRDLDRKPVGAPVPIPGTDNFRFLIFFKWTNPVSFCLFSFFSHYKYSANWL